MKRILVLVPLLLLVLVFFLWRQGTPYRSDNDPLLLYGNIDVRVVNLAFEVNGRIAEMRVAEGARVSAGQPLAQLDKHRLQLNLDSARARLSAARVEAENAERNAQRQQELVEKKLTSPRDAEYARTTADTAKAQISVAEAAQALAEQDLADAVLIAPADSIVQSRILEPGDMASPERPVYTLAIREPLWARVYIAESELGKVKPGMPALIHSDSYPDKGYPGWVGYISPSAEFTPKSVETTEIRADLVYQARIFTCNPHDELRQGMPVTVTLELTATPLTTPGCDPQQTRHTP